MTVPVEPMFIGGQQVLVKFYALQRHPDEPQRIEGTFTLVGGEGVLTLDALVGPKGNPGEPSPIIRVQWDQTGIVTSVEDLPNPATLDDSDDGRAWFIDGWYHVYSDADGDYHKIQGSIPGPPGVTPDISITAKAVEASGPVYGPLTVNETGTSTEPGFEIEIPLLPGPPGPSAAIESAADYDDSVSAQDGDILIFNEETEKWRPGNPGIVYPKLYSIPEANFIAYEGNAGRRGIATLNVPAMPFAWYPKVDGHVRIRRSGLLSTCQVEVEVRLGETGMSGTGEDAPLCGLAPYDPTTLLFDSVTIAHIMTHYSDVTDPLRSVSPDTSVGRVPEGQAMTFYVFTHKVGGSGNYQFTKPQAHLTVEIVPVN